MRLRSGIPLLSELDEHLRSDEYARHLEFNRSFLARHGSALEGYGKLWGQDPLKLWSRRWEYPFVTQRVVDFARARPDPGEPFRMLDAGSGVTYFPYLVCAEVPGAEVTCFDANPAYHAMFEALRRAEPQAKVRFVEGVLQKMPFETAAFDAVCCISVLEHTDDYSTILDEFRRVLRPGGLLVLTFDLSLDGKFELARDRAASLLTELAQKFDATDGTDHALELARMDQPEVILTTEHVRRTEPDLLPWRYPMLKAVHDLVKGHGWTGGFRSKSIYCLDVRARA